jgi:UDP-N-acetylglucosamine--N-acetylmuramyl-(pentapeptide) pyrophosphoryl-undecaprenol N-acetylglucosamine transferase
VLPGLAVAEELAKRGDQVRLWLTGRDTERELVDGWDLEKIELPSAALSGRLSFSTVAAVVQTAKSYRAGLRLIKQDLPRVMLAMGSYASVVPVLAARRRQVPVVVHEGNSVPGRAVTFLRRYASCIALAYESAAAYLDKAETETTGFPLPEIRPLGSESFKAPENATVILISGGSQGAEFLNDVGADAMCALAARMPVYVLHIAGRGNSPAVRDRYRDGGVSAQVVDFVKNMHQAYEVSDIAVTRAGAASCAELRLFGVPAVLVPYPYAARDHQLVNALELRNTGGAEVLKQEETGASDLARAVEKIATAEETKRSMRLALLENADQAAASAVADLLERVAGKC